MLNHFRGSGRGRGSRSEIGGSHNNQSYMTCRIV